MIKYKFTNNYNFKGKIYKRGEFFEVDKTNKQKVADLRMLLGSKMVIAMKEIEGKDKLRQVTQLEEGKDALEIKNILTSNTKIKINKVNNKNKSKGKK